MDIKVSIIEDQKDIREMLAVLINGSNGFCCINTYDCAEDAIIGIPNSVPDVVLVDIHLAEGIFTLRSSMDIRRETFHEDIYLSVLKKHKIDQKVFEASVLYYGKHPEKYKPIYDDVVDLLNEMDVRSKAKDSIQNIKLKPKVIDAEKIKK